MRTFHISEIFFSHYCPCLWFPEHPLGASLIFYFPPFLFPRRCLGIRWWFSLQFTWFIMLNPLTKCACLKSYSTVETICFGARMYYGCWGSLPFWDCTYICINFFFFFFSPHLFLLFWRNKSPGSLLSLPPLDFRTFISFSSIPVLSEAPCCFSLRLKYQSLLNVSCATSWVVIIIIITILDAANWTWTLHRTVTSYLTFPGIVFAWNRLVTLTGGW